MSYSKDMLLLFDVDGTLSESRKVIEPWMKEFMDELRNKVTVGIVGGSDLVKIAEQLGGLDNTLKFKYVFSENGLVAHKDGQLINEMSIQKHMGEDILQKLINFALRYMSDLVLPVKRGTFVEFRKGLINFCPVGRSCSQEERDQFSEYDKKHHIRQQFIDALKNMFTDADFYFTIGGQISVDVYPRGWDKTFCLQFVENEFKEIHFFGDKTAPGGNDHTIYEDSRTIGHTVTSPKDTMDKVMKLLQLS